MSTITAIPSAFQSATNSIHNSAERVAQDAHVIANSSTAETSSNEQRDVLNALVDARQQVVYTKAAAKVIRAADEMFGNLLDTRV